MSNTIDEPAQKIKIFKETDVLVVGGGTAGYVAAISAARHGVDVILLERYGCLGGMATGGLVLLFDSLDDGKGNLLVKGIVEETINRLKKLDGVVSPPKEVWGSTNKEDVNKWTRWGATGVDKKLVRYCPVVDPEMLKYVAAQMVKEAGVNVLLHCWASKAFLEDNKVNGVIFESKSGRLAIKSKVTVDCTGDGDIFSSAGAEFNFMHLPMGLIFRVGNVKIAKAEKYSSKIKSKKFSDRLREMGGISGGYNFGDIPAGFYMHSSNESVVWFNNIIKGNALNIEDLTKVEIEVRKAMLNTLTLFKDEVPGFENAYIIDTASQIGTRSSRTLIGEHILTIDELQKGEMFEDTVCVLQPPYRNFSPEDPLKYVPYRSFVPRKIDNLLVAGRCFSADFRAIEMMRLIPSVMLMGQASGVAAAIAVESSKVPRDIAIKDLQRELKKQGVIIP